MPLGILLSLFAAMASARRCPTLVLPLAGRGVLFRDFMPATCLSGYEVGDRPGNHCKQDQATHSEFSP